jgi:hypothetical protein
MLFWGLSLQLKKLFSWEAALKQSATRKDGSYVELNARYKRRFIIYDGAAFV